METGNDVFIGARVTILKGVRVGDSRVIAAGAVLSPGFEAPPLSIAAGNPARVVGHVAPAADCSLAAEQAAVVPQFMPVLRRAVFLRHR